MSLMHLVVVTFYVFICYECYVVVLINAVNRIIEMIKDNIIKTLVKKYDYFYG